VSRPLEILGRAGIVRGVSDLVDPRGTAFELYRLLRDIDPARLRAQLDTGVRQRVETLRARVRALADAAPSGAIRERFRELAHLLESGAPTLAHGGERFAAACQELRASLVPAYERLAASLANLDIHVPSLRPTNYKRNAFHVTTGLAILVLIQHVLNATGLIVAACVFAGTFWALEIGRRFSTRLNAALLRFFRHVAHPHEAWRVNSSTWFGTAMVVLALLREPMAASVAVVVMGFGDPAAALIGRRYGRVKLLNGRSLEGSLTFFAVGLAAGLAVLTAYADFAWGARLALAAAAAFAGAVAELVSRRVDDNLSVPVCAALAFLAARSLVG
jgi:dolichol kinase